MPGTFDHHADLPDCTVPKIRDAVGAMTAGLRGVPDHRGNETLILEAGRDIAIPPEIFGRLLPLFIHAVPGAIFSGVPPYSLWEHPPKIGKIPPHRADAGCLILAECFGCKSFTFVKDVKGLYTTNARKNADAEFIPKISVSELRERNLPTLPFDEVCVDVLATGRLMKQFQIIDGRQPDLITRTTRADQQLLTSSETPRSPKPASPTPAADSRSRRTAP